MFLVVAIEIGKILFQVFEFGHVVDSDVGAVRIIFEVVLVIVLGGEKGFKGFDFGDDAVRVDFRDVELRDVGFGDALLRIGGVQNGGAVLRAYVRILPVELRRVVGHRKIDH